MYEFYIHLEPNKLAWEGASEVKFRRGKVKTRKSKNIYKIQNGTVIVQSAFAILIIADI